VIPGRPITYSIGLRRRPPSGRQDLAIYNHGFASIIGSRSSRGLARSSRRCTAQSCCWPCRMETPPRLRGLCYPSRRSRWRSSSIPRLLTGHIDRQQRPRGPPQCRIACRPTRSCLGLRGAAGCMAIAGRVDKLPEYARALRCSSNFAVPALLLLVPSWFVGVASRDRPIGPWCLPPSCRLRPQTCYPHIYRRVLPYRMQRPA